MTNAAGVRRGWSDRAVSICRCSGSWRSANALASLCPTAGRALTWALVNFFTGSARELHAALVNRDSGTPQQALREVVIRHFLQDAQDKFA